MNRMHALVAALALALALPAAAQTAQEPNLKVLPPPSLNDPGVKPGEPDRSGQKPIEKPVPYDQAPPTQSSPATSDAQGSKVSAANLPAMQDNGQVDANGNTAPQVTVHTEGTDTVEEYRTAGRLTMIRVTPKNGVPYTVMANENGKLVRDSGTRNVSPVYYKVYEWGAAPKPAGSD
ncbi:DUF2782 domain-containing protein [Luteibacter aegosomaticola]|jgi:hypothetical protein|uniref:DUF2782 domain-containing protein n=1 Tax=Luteibacter aegosomaticola TaxID=2911538 RepID=UPI001FF9BA54|nr:DUF2782 domain-containing protein [Luteibacter aegosomaticola]UPG90767.1 DUF2782 domain-containing protein [Luteibacter aegosomaticola]